MATIYSLFLGVLSVAVLLLGSLDNRTVEEHNVRSSSYDLVVFRDGASEHGSPGRVRERIVDIARNEIGVKEVTDNNDGVRVEEYLAHTGLGKGHAWCAAFVSWCYGQLGLPAPRSVWSQALFPVARSYTKERGQRRVVQPADLFAIYSQKLRRIDHVGIMQKMQGNWIQTMKVMLITEYCLKDVHWLRSMLFQIGWIERRKDMCKIVNYLSIYIMSMICLGSCKLYQQKDKAELQSSRNVWQWNEFVQGWYNLQRDSLSRSWYFWNRQ